jgi:AraC family transcriptional regulator
MKQELISPPNMIERGPSWSGQQIQDPVWATRATIGPRLDEDEHVLSRYQFTVHLGDAMPVDVYRSGKRKALITRFGDLTWTAAGDSCRDRWQQPREMGFLTLSKGFVSRVADEAGAGKPPDDATVEPVDALTRELVLAVVQHDCSDRVYLQTLASSLVTHLVRSMGQRKFGATEASGRLTARQLRRAIDYADSRLGEDLDLESWAREVALSPYHFARCFKRTIGLSPHQFLLNRRVERAKSILASSDVPFSAIAYDLGFANQSHFHRVFRKEARMTPGEWRSAAGIRQSYQG